MKKYWKLLLLAAGIGIFNACEDVPEPYNIPTENGGGATPTTVEPTGTGTLEDPFNAAAAIAAAKELPSGTESEELYFIKGVVNSVTEAYSASFGNATFYIADEVNSTTQFLVYRALYLDNKKYTSGDNIEVGDTVAVCGKITYYNGKTPETVQNQAYLYSLKKGNGTPQTPIEGAVGSGTKDDPYDVPTTIKLIAAGPPSTKIYTKGIVSQVDEISEQYGNATYYISNDGSTTDQLEVYRGMGLGGAKFQANGLEVGDEVIVYGQVVYWNNKTMEFTQGSELYMLNGETAGNAPAPTGEEVTCAQAVELTITGYITQIVGSVSKNQQTFWMADTKDGGKVFEAFYANLPEGVSEFKVGSKVKITGQLQKYVKDGKVTPEIKNANVEILEEGGDTPAPEPSGEAKGTGTLSDPFNAVAASNTATALGSGNTSTEDYYIKGIISTVKYTFDESHGTATFFISENGKKNDEFQVYSTFYLGNKSWKEGNMQIKEGDEVIIFGKLTNYNGTPETASKKSYIYSLNGKTTDDGDNGGEEPDPNVGGTSLADFTNGDFETWENGKPSNWESSSSKATLSQSTIAHGGQYSCRVEHGTQNQRLAYKDMTLEAGSYTVSAYVRAAETTAVARIGYHGNAYTYGATTDVTTEWQQLTYTFELNGTTTVSLLLMNSASGADAILVDDYTITKK